MVDIATFILSILLLIYGARRGFINSLLVPCSILIATIISIIYYQLTNGVIVSLLIGLIGPPLLNLLFRYLVKKWAAATNSEIKPSFLSRLGGSLLTLAWGWVFIVFALVLLAVLPPWGKGLTILHKDVTNSASYFFAKPMGEAFFAASNPKVPASSTTTSTTTAAPANNDAKLLADDPRFQKVLEDPDIQKEIDAHDIVKLMSNPKMIDLTHQIMSDPATMKKVLAIYSSQSQPEVSTKNP